MNRSSKIQIQVTQKQLLIISQLADKEALSVASYVRSRLFRQVNSENCNILADSDDKPLIFIDQKDLFSKEGGKRGRKKQSKII